MPLIDTQYVLDRMTVPAAQLGALSGFVAGASAAVESHCHRTFAATDYDERYSSDGGRLFLRNRPVISIASIATGYASPTTVDPARYTFDPETAEVYGVGGGDAWYPWSGDGWDLGTGIGSGFGGFRDVRVVYRAGYEIIPADVQLATFLVVQAAIHGAARNPTVQSETLGPHSKTYVAGAAAQATGLITGMVADLLRPYVVMRF